MSNREGRPLKILQVNTSDVGGGAESVAAGLFYAYRNLGLHSWLAVGRKITDDRDIFLIPKPARFPLIQQGLNQTGKKLPSVLRHAFFFRAVREILSCGFSLTRSAEALRGHEDFFFPESRRILELPPEMPDVIHCHNLHGGFFDLNVLAFLSRVRPVVLTLHDQWLMTGHCAHDFGCLKWKEGCGQCPDPDMYSPLLRDGTVFNFQRKRGIYAKSRLYIAAISDWLARRMRESMLFPAAAESRVIVPGVDTSVFYPADRQAARRRLKLVPNAKVLLFAANGIRDNPFKDFDMICRASARVAERLDSEDLLLIGLGQTAPDQRFGKATVRYIPFQRNLSVVADYYRAADIYVHAAKAEVWGLTVTEAMACGLAVVATAVGGIPEQIEEGDSGYLVEGPDAEEQMAERITRLLSDKDLRESMGHGGVANVQRRFTLERQAKDYLSWYRQILERK